MADDAGFAANHAHGLRWSNHAMIGAVIGSFALESRIAGRSATPTHSGTPGRGRIGLIDQRANGDERVQSNSNIAVLDDSELIQRAHREAQLLVPLLCRGFGRGLTGPRSCPLAAPRSQRDASSAFGASPGRVDRRREATKWRADSAWNRVRPSVRDVESGRRCAQSISTYVAMFYEIVLIIEI